MQTSRECNAQSHPLPRALTLSRPRVSTARVPPPDPRHTRLRKPPLRLQTTTLWEYPSQHYGDGHQGDPRYVGATPSYVIWNVLQRYTVPDSLVVDPMCGSGTTLDVARDLGRRAKGFDLAPYRADILRADARKLPLESASVDLVFLDPPYSDHIRYSDDPACIGRLSALEPGYFRAMGEVFVEVHRVLRPGGILALYVCDYFEKKKGFAPVGFGLFSVLTMHLAPIDVVSVVRHNHSLEQGNFHQAAERDNFFLRGFNYLFLARRPLDDPSPPRPPRRGGRSPR